MVRNADRLLEVDERDLDAGGYRPVTLFTDRGEVECHYYEVADSRCAVVFIGGVGGDFDTPASQLYPHLCKLLQRDHIASLRVQFRNPVSLEESAFDVEAGLAYLASKGIERIAIVGHSFGGAVAIQAAARNPAVRTVVTLATQGHGADAASRLGPRCSLLLLHGEADHVLNPIASQHVYRIATEPKQLILYPNAGHGLDEVAEDVHRTVLNWLQLRLPGNEGCR